MIEALALYAALLAPVEIQSYEHLPTAAECRQALKLNGDFRDRVAFLLQAAPHFRREALQEADREALALENWWQLALTARTAWHSQWVGGDRFESRPSWEERHDARKELTDLIGPCRYAVRDWPVALPWWRLPTW